MQRKFVKTNAYNAGKGKTNQELTHLHMSNHYRRILNAKKVIDNSPPYCYRVKRPATSNPPPSRNNPTRHLDSPALTDRSVSTNSYRGSFWGTESCLGSSRYHTNCIPNDTFSTFPPPKRTGIDMDLVDRITFDTKKGPAAYCDEGWMEEKSQKERKCEVKQNKTISSATSKTHPPTKGSEGSPQKQKFNVQKELKSEGTAKGKESFAVVSSERRPKKSEAVSKLRGMRVYYPPRRKKTRQDKMEDSSNHLAATTCECTKICVCDANETAFKKTPPNAKEQSQTSSRDSAYNGGISSLPESRSPTPDHRRKKDCCCCCCEKKQRDTHLARSKATTDSPRLRHPFSRPPTPKAKSHQHQDSLKKMKEDALYVKFVQDITVEVLERNLYTNKALKKVMKKHLRRNLEKLNKERMVEEVEKLRMQLGIPEDKALLDVEGDAEEVSMEGLKGYPMISDSEFSMPKHLVVGQEAGVEGSRDSRKVPVSISGVLSELEEGGKIGLGSETDEEEVISVIQMKKVLGEKRKEKCGGKCGAGAGREPSSDESDRPSEPKKRSTGHSVKQKLMRSFSSSSCESDVPEEKVRMERERERERESEGVGEASTSEELCSEEYKHKCSCLSLERRHRSVSFWNNPDLSDRGELGLKQKKGVNAGKEKAGS